MIDRDLEPDDDTGLSGEKALLLAEAATLDAKEKIWIIQGYTIEFYLHADWPMATRHVVQSGSRVRVQGISKVELASRFASTSLAWTASYVANSDLHEKTTRLYEQISARKTPQEVIKPPFVPPIYGTSTPSQSSAQPGWESSQSPSGHVPTFTCRAVQLVPLLAVSSRCYRKADGKTSAASFGRPIVCHGPCERSVTALPKPDTRRHYAFGPGIDQVFHFCDHAHQVGRSSQPVDGPRRAGRAGRLREDLKSTAMVLRSGEVVARLLRLVSARRTPGHRCGVLISAACWPVERP